MLDQVCISEPLFRICTDETAFYAREQSSSIDADYPNIIGLGDKSAGKGPTFIKGLADQGMIDNNIVTININPSRGNWRSNVTFGGVPDDLISGIYYDHTYQIEDLGNYNDLMILPLAKLSFGDNAIIDTPEGEP